MANTNYSQFLRGELWLGLRGVVLAREGAYCERCGEDASHVHHLSYSKGWHCGARIDGDGCLDLSNADLSLLQAICEECHQYLHGKIEYDPAKLDWVARITAALNRIRY